MVRITKVYTRTGDTGETGLVGGTRLLKDHPRIEGFGTVDELNSCLGLVRSFNAQKPQSERRDKLELILQAIQQKLFDMGSNWPHCQVTSTLDRSSWRKPMSLGWKK